MNTPGNQRHARLFGSLLAPAFPKKTLKNRQTGQNAAYAESVLAKFNKELEGRPWGMTNTEIEQARRKPFTNYVNKKNRKSRKTRKNRKSRKTRRS